MAFQQHESLEELAALNLSLVPPERLEHAQELFADGDVIGLLCLVGSGRALALVADNVRAFLDRGVYEAALVDAFTGCRINNSAWSLSALQFLFRLGNREKLLAAGPPLPGKGPFTVYRGVAGEGRRRMDRGLSWTDCLDTACWFALRLDLPDPAVYTTSLAASDVYCMGPREREFIGRPRRCKLVRMSMADMKEGAKRHTCAMRQADAARWPI